MAERFQEASTAVRDLIHKSKLLGEGPPARYRLLTTRSNLDENGLLRKWTFGQRDVNMQNKILLMVGETGTGKTTLINAMVNYILGVKFTDEVWFEITEEGGNKSDQSESQTSEITVYEVFSQENPICLTIIDTPGYGDTKGTDVDKQIAENLYKLFRNDTGVKEIDAVCLVVKASENRLSDRQQYIFDAVLSSFGKDIENNIVIYITHSDGMPPTNALNAIKKAGVPCRKDEENEPEHFLFNNRQAEKRSKKYNKALQTAWEQTEDNLNIFYDSLKEGNRKSLEQTESVLTESIRLEACISNLQKRIDFVGGKSKELAQIQKSLEENQEKIKGDQNFTFTVTRTEKKKVPIEDASWWDRKATSCSVCKENCHETNCWTALSPYWCKVMDKDHCLVCKGKCHYSKHVRENKKYETFIEETTMTYYDLKQQYDSKKKSSDIEYDLKAFENVDKKVDSNKKEEEKNINVEKELNKDLTKHKQEKADLVDEAYKAITRLFNIALKPDSAFIIQALNFLIPQAEEIEKFDYAQTLRELRSAHPESQEKVHTVMGYFSKVKAAVTGTK